MDLDPRWGWIEVTAVGDRERQYVKGLCRHTETVPVTSVTGRDRGAPVPYLRQPDRGLKDAPVRFTGT